MSTSPYHQAGKMMQQILTERKSIKTIAFSKSKLLCSKSTYAQVCNTLQHKTVIDSILNHNSGYLRKAIEMDKARSSGLVYVLLFELLFGKYRSIRGGGKIKRCIMKFEKGLNKTKSLIVKDSLNTTNQLVVPVFPRYVRVNKLKATTEEVVKLLKNDLDSSDGDDNGINDIYQDVHVPDLLVLSPKIQIQWHDSKLVSSGKIVLQDKSSCFSALALVHGSESTSTDQANAGDIIDATAAPGNKTLHLAALVYDNILKDQKGKKGSKKKKKKVKVFAFDRSSARIAIKRTSIQPRPLSLTRR
jgi:putative methyltransferase